MSDYLKLNWKYLLGAALVHGLFAAIFGLTMISMSRDAPQPQLAIQAVIVDQSLIGAASRREQQEKEQQKQRAEQREREQAAADQRRQQEEAAQLEAKQKAEQQAEQERQVELKQREEQEQRRVQEEQQVRERQETERKREADAQRQKQAEAERQRVADIARKQKEEAQRRKTAEDARVQAAREAELKNQLADEEGRMQAENSGLNNQYAALIRQHIERNWNRPPSARGGLECEIKVAQTPSGVVLSVQVGQCNGDAAVKQSIETAVLRASPLPPPPDPRLFQRNVTLIFKPAD
jgi:colicin import membrane protein